MNNKWIANVRTILKMRGIEEPDFEAALGLGGGFFSKLADPETENDPGAENLFIISRKLGVSVEALILDDFRNAADEYDSLQKAIRKMTMDTIDGKIVWTNLEDAIKAEGVSALNPFVLNVCARKGQEVNKSYLEEEADNDMISLIRGIRFRLQKDVFNNRVVKVEKVLNAGYGQFAAPIYGYIPPYDEDVYKFKTVVIAEIDPETIAVLVEHRTDVPRIELAWDMFFCKYNAAEKCYDATFIYSSYDDMDTMKTYPMFEELEASIARHAAEESKISKEAVQELEGYLKESWKKE